MKLDRFDYFVYPHEVDATKRITLYNLGAYILNAAGMAATKRGFGMNDLHQRGDGWVVSRMAVEMQQMPKEYETISIDTWVESCSAAASVRNFRIYDSENAIIGEATTIWSIINLNSRRLVNLLQSTNLKSHQVEEHIAIEMSGAKKIIIPQDTLLVSERTHTVVYSDIDMNRHVNSMRYLQWAIDSLSLDEMIKSDIKRFDINYLQEALYGESITIKHNSSEENELFELSSEKVCCRIKIQMR